MAAPLPDPAADARREAFRVDDGRRRDRPGPAAPVPSLAAHRSSLQGVQRTIRDARLARLALDGSEALGEEPAVLRSLLHVASRLRAIRRGDRDHAPVRGCPRFDDPGRTGRRRRVPHSDQPLLPDRERRAAPHGRPCRQVHRRRRDGHVHPGDVRPRPRGERDRGRADASSTGSRAHPRPSGCPSGSGSTPGRRSWERSGMRRRSRTSRRSATP